MVYKPILVLNGNKRRRENRFTCDTISVARLGA